jgi:hypothetical protein
MSAEPNLAVIHREMRDAATKLEELLVRVAVALVLLDGVIYRLFGEPIFELEREDRQAVDKKHQVQRPLRLIA